VPLLVAGRETAPAERWLREDAGAVVWTLTRVELLSASARRRRQEPGAARRELLAAWERWWEVTAVDLVRRHAERFVESHPLRAAEDDPAGLDFVTLDRQQALAAEREGFRVLGS